MIAVERLDAFMARANAEYYATHDPFRDFTTSPEISQVFGELLGAWAVVVWNAMGRPDPVVLAELGPGRGTLMADALRTIRTVAPGLAAALSLHLVETSPRLRDRQAEKLGTAHWHDSVDTLPQQPTILLANEFLDALPIRQFVRRGEVWIERWVDAGSWIERLAPGFEAEGEVFEVSETAEQIVAEISRRVTAQPGAALFLDYGGTKAADTLQAIRAGEPADPLSDPGHADLTAHVDFARLTRVASAAGAAVHGPVPQGKFLARLGLFQRTDRLARGQPPSRAGALIAAAQRLAEPMHMGRLFKAFALVHPSLPTSPGFSE